MQRVIFYLFLLIPIFSFAEENPSLSEREDKVRSIFSSNYESVRIKYKMDHFAQDRRGNLLSTKEFHLEREKIKDEFNALLTKVLVDEIGNPGRLLSRLAIAKDSKKDEFVNLLSKWKSENINNDAVTEVINYLLSDSVSGNYISLTNNQVLSKLIDEAGLLDRNLMYCSAVDRVLSFEQMNCHDNFSVDRALKELDKIIKTMAAIRKDIKRKNLQCSGVPLKEYVLAMKEFESLNRRSFEGLATGDCRGKINERELVAIALQDDFDKEVQIKLSEIELLSEMKKLNKHNYEVKIGDQKIETQVEYLACDDSDKMSPELVKKYANKMLESKNWYLDSEDYVLEDFKEGCGGQMRFIVKEPIDATKKPELNIEEMKLKLRRQYSF